ncbi:MAG: OsmC family protein [Candidatus Limnocylindrales bacterium]
MVKSKVNVRQLQAPIRERCQGDATAGLIELRVSSAPTDLGDPLHCAVTPLAVPHVVIRAGAHPAVGGAGDEPCSGDLLLAALAACQETTLRMVAANMGIDLISVEVDVRGDWDARGTLAVPGAPIGITAVRCHTTIVVGGDERGDRADRLLRSAEKYCVILNTLRSGVNVESRFDLQQA